MTERQQQIETLLLQLLQGTDIFLVKLGIRPTNNVKVYLDSSKGLSIADSGRVNRALYKKIEETAIFGAEDFSLEVSSPGVDEPLADKRQYQRHIGREILFELQEEEQPFVAKLNAIEGDHLHVKTKDEKKKPGEEKTISFEKIKSAIVQISFK